MESEVENMKEGEKGKRGNESWRKKLKKKKD